MLANCQRVRATRDKLVATLNQLGFHTLPSQTNFLLTRPPCDAERMFLALRERGFLVRYFRDERIRDRIRVSIGNDEEMDAFAEACRAILTELGAKA
jgi:histidinol-phosphate aminotransferase